MTDLQQAEQRIEQAYPKKSEYWACTGTDVKAKQRWFFQRKPKHEPGQTLRPNKDGFFNANQSMNRCGERFFTQKRTQKRSLVVFHESFGYGMENLLADAPCLRLCMNAAKRAI